MAPPSSNWARFSAPVPICCRPTTSRNWKNCRTTPRLCRWSVAKGTLAIRSHVDICDDRLLA
ncbi:MAG TPA: hypothetical protein EYP41_13675, partial [Anaerolineae bacterium]|nr:hypothetical protein [Anaerolineae bacterium]